uniref:Uncharacterized protein n=1 Tax=Oryza sativa subsp. japonica TaxID=39947 RepID=Q6K1T0_ORYSJ|nr:hypothetical protein [Oryza sativa Japonica Group]
MLRVRHREIPPRHVLAIPRHVLAIAPSSLIRACRGDLTSIYLSVGDKRQHRYGSLEDDATLRLPSSPSPSSPILATKGRAEARG